MPAFAANVQEDIENPPPSAWELGPPTPPARGLNILISLGRVEYCTILEALFSIDMITLFVASTCGIGGTLTAIHNLGEIGRAQGYSASTATTFISLICIWNYFGRVISGFIAETLLFKYKFPRPPILSLVLQVSCFGHLFIAFGVPKSLLVASAIIGFSFGAEWRLLFAIISEIFDLKYYSTLYNFGALSSPVGMYILNVNVARRLYNQEALKQMEIKGPKMLAGEDLTCIGIVCYKKAFIIITAVTQFGCVVSLILVLRTRKLYKKFREQAEATAVEVEVEVEVEEPANLAVPLSTSG